MNDPHIWWYVTRTSAILAWILLTISVLWGVLLSTRVARKIDNPAWLQDLHRFLSGIALVMVLLHIGSLLLDPYINMSFADVAIPFATSFKPFPVALGIVSTYLLLAVYLSSRMMNRLPRPLWKAVHYASYAVVLGVAFHAGWTGTDVSQLWYRIVAGILIGATAAAAIIRAVAGRPGAPRTARGTEVGAASSSTNERTTVLGSQTLVVTERVLLTPQILQLTFAAGDGRTLGHWEPGDHISLRLGNGVTRQYSLCGDPADDDRWTIAVRRAETEDGGSRWIHSHLTVGAEVIATGPVQAFPFAAAHEYVFVAAGIGITPIRAMIYAVPAHRPWRLIYLGSRQAEMAFAEELHTQFPDQVTLWDREQRGSRFDLTDLRLRERAALYACGPESVLDELERIIPANQLHLERFVPENRAPDADATPFEVECRKSDVVVTVAASETMLEALERADIPVFPSCREGVCGTCEVRVLDGTPEHHDQLLTDAEKTALGVMYPCVSRAAGGRIVVDA